MDTSNALNTLDTFGKDSPHHPRYPRYFFSYIVLGGRGNESPEWPTELIDTLFLVNLHTLNCTDERLKCTEGSPFLFIPLCCSCLLQGLD